MNQSTVSKFLSTSKHRLKKDVPAVVLCDGTAADAKRMQSRQLPGVICANDQQNEKKNEMLSCAQARTTWLVVRYVTEQCTGSVVSGAQAFQVTAQALTLSRRPLPILIHVKLRCGDMLFNAGAACNANWQVSRFRCAYGAIYAQAPKRFVSERRYSWHITRLM